VANKLTYSLKHNSKAILLFIVLITIGFCSNYFAPQLFTGFSYYFGSIPVLLIMLLFGLPWGLLAALTVSAGTILQQGHAYSMLWLCAEPFFVGWLLSRGRTRNIILYDAFYWPLLGAPILFLSSTYLMHSPSNMISTNILLYWTAGIINAVAASLMITYIPFQRFLDNSAEHSSLPIQQLIFNLMMATALSPTIVIVVANSKIAAPQRLTDKAIEVSQLAAPAPYPENLGNTLLALLCLNMLALITSLYTSRRLAAPLRQLTRITTDLPDQLMKGKSTPWPESMVKEIDQLSYNFRTMATALSYKFQEITYYSESLETRVKERTRELTKANNQLRKEIIEHQSTEKHRNQLLFELQNKNKELEGIVYVASHDLRSPLVNVQGFSQKLAAGCEDLEKLTAGLEMEPERQQKLDRILRVNIPKYIGFITGSVDKMGLLLKGLLRLSRLGQASLCFDRLDMKKIMENIISSMTFQIDSIKAQINLGDLEPCTSDAGQVTQVFSNLLDNTIKFKSPDRPLVVNIFSEEFGEGIRYCVEDNGIGISDAHKDKIWEIFHRLNPEVAPGEGMGLTLTRQIVSRLGGSIWVESEPGVGSRFYVLFPKTLTAE
jgi:signal transduction histidine kinase